MLSLIFLLATDLYLAKQLWIFMTGDGSMFLVLACLFCMQFLPPESFMRILLLSTLQSQPEVA